MRSTATLVLPFALAALSCQTTGGSLCDELVDPNDPTSGCCSGASPGSCTVRAPEYLADLRQNNVMQRPAQGSPVHLRNLSVAAIDTYSDSPSNRTGNVYLEQFVTQDQLAADPRAPGFQGCVPYMNGVMCGIQVFGATVVPVGTHLIPGDIVNADGGSYDEFTCATCRSQFDQGHSLPELSMVSLQRIGSAFTPISVPVTLADLQAHADQYIGVLVTIANPGAVNSDTRGNLTIGTGTAPFQLTTDLSALQDAHGTTLADGCTLTRLTGIVSYFFNPQLLPRSPSDIEIAACP